MKTYYIINDIFVSDRDEIVDSIYLDEGEVVLLSGVPLADVAKLNAKWEDFCKEFKPSLDSLDEDITEFLEWLGYDGAKGEYGDGEPVIYESEIIFDNSEEDKFYTPEETGYMYGYFDEGSNWQTIWSEEFTTVAVEEDAYFDLDEWDGSNFYTVNQGEHEEVYKVLEINDSPVDEDDPTFLLIHSSNWAGVETTAGILGKTGLQRHLNEINRDVVEVMDSLGE
jgi:hypothetical protein